MFQSFYISGAGGVKKLRQTLWGNRKRAELRLWMFAIAPTIVAIALIFAVPYWLATPQTMASEPPLVKGGSTSDSHDPRTPPSPPLVKGGQGGSKNKVGFEVEKGGSKQEQRPPVRTQQANIREVWRVVYQRLPDFPLENNYVNKKTGEVDPENTLASRLLAYHLQIKSRLPTYRLDWKLTLADYLGANEEIDPSRYPGWDVFRENPAAGDRVAISKLNRSGRDALILVLVTIFNPNYDKSSETSTPSSPEGTSPSSPPPLPQSGDADLLK